MSRKTVRVGVRWSLVWLCSPLPLPLPTSLPLQASVLDLYGLLHGVLLGLGEVEPRLTELIQVCRAGHGRLGWRAVYACAGGWMVNLRLTAP